MKKNLSKLLMLFCLVALAACSNELNPGFNQDDYEPIVAPDPVHTLTSMASGERVVLSGTSLEDIILSWTPTEKHGNTVYRYEVLFDTIGGDFSNPIQEFKADNNGVENQLTLSHYQANAIGKIAKFSANTNGTLRWKIRAYCGLDQAISSLEGYFVIFMMDGIDNIPGEEDDVYITGEATEDLGVESKAQKMLRLENGTYQVFTRVQANKPFTFISTIAGQKYSYYIDYTDSDGNKLRQRNDANTNSSEFSESAIYRITLDFETQVVDIAKVERLYFYCFSGPQQQDLSYIGYGKWRVKNFIAQKKSESWAASGEVRHKFIMDITTRSGTNEIQWGQEKNDAAFSTNQSYFNLYISPEADKSHYCFIYNNDLVKWGAQNGNYWYATVPCDITVCFNTDFGVYTHYWTASN